MQNFASRHLGPRQNEVAHMLQTIGVDSIDTLIDQTVPAAIRLQKPLNIAPAMSEADYLKHVAELGKLNPVSYTHLTLPTNREV